MENIKLPEDKEVYLFEIDDVIYPKKDFVLQTYYLFAQFVEYTEGREVANEILHFLKESYENTDEDDLLQKTKEKFGLKEDYKENLNRLQANGHLPLKLLLFDNIKLVFADLISKNKHIAILTKGNPVLQLNKLRHIDWQGLDKFIKIFFVDELIFRNLEPFDYIAKEFGITPKDIIYIEQQI